MLLTNADLNCVQKRVCRHARWN